jgi:hypothetical protein
LVDNKELHDKFPALSRALHDDALPWGKMVRGLESVQKMAGSFKFGTRRHEIRVWSVLNESDELANGNTWSEEAFRAIKPLRIANSYESKLLPSWKGDKEGVNKWGGVRTNLEMEVSADPGCEGGAGEWRGIDLRYQLGSLLRPPAWSGMHLPRLDWLVFAEADHEDWRRSAWFVRLMAKVLERPASVMSLLADGSADGPAPMCVKATLFNYELARHDEFASVGAVFGAEFSRNDISEQRGGIQGDGVEGEEAEDSDDTKGEHDTWWFRTKVRDFTPPLTQELLQCSPQPDCLPEGEAHILKSILFSAGMLSTHYCSDFWEFLAARCLGWSAPSPLYRPLKMGCCADVGGGDCRRRWRGPGNLVGRHPWVARSVHFVGGKRCAAPRWSRQHRGGGGGKGF